MIPRQGSSRLAHDSVVYRRACGAAFRVRSRRPGSSSYLLNDRARGGRRVNDAFAAFLMPELSRPPMPRKLIATSAQIWPPRWMLSFRNPRPVASVAAGRHTRAGASAWR
jgi:hypothetical protein